MTKTEAQQLADNITDFADAYRIGNPRLIKSTQETLSNYIQSLVVEEPEIIPSNPQDH